MEYIKGTYVKEIYINENNGYIVGIMRVDDASNKDIVNKVITFTGIFDELKYKMNYKFTGEFTNHNKYGMQFQVESYELIMPTEEEEIIEFLSSDLFPIGEKTAEKIVHKLGKDALNIMLNDPLSLIGIPRLTESKINKIIDVLSDYQASSKLVMELNKMGFGTKTSLAIYKKYGNNSLKVIDDNIYTLIDDIDITFDELDKLAKNNGYAKDDERRLLALVIDVMKKLCFNNGDTYLYFDEIYNYILSDNDNINSETIEYILLKLSKLNKIVILNDRYYLKSFYDDETYIVNRIYKLNETTRRKLPKLENKINALELVMGITYDESQKEAIMKSLNNNLTIITGGPGTGKTTIIKCIVRLLLDIMQVKSENLALLAPTGRAARKLMETTGVPSYTVHKYLKWDKESNTFEIDEFNPNKEEYIIVDEASMIDTNLMASLLRGTLAKAKFVFVGDYYQLPSVREGQILKDLIDSDLLDVVKLDCLYRQSEESYINTLAYEIKNRNVYENFLYQYDDYNFITSPSERIKEVIEEIVKKALNKGYTDKDIQVLAPIYKSENGIDALNKMLQRIMNPKSPNKNEITSGDVIYREGDKILQLVNDSDNAISNGDIGYIEAININGKKHEIIINYDGIRVTYTPKDFINITHGYAISVHKSQGGEFKMVIIPFAKSYKRMLYNKLVYTAVTRAKQSLILVGDADAFLYGVNNDYIDNRKTTIKEFLENKYNN